MPLEIRVLEETDVPTFVSIMAAAMQPSPVGRAMHESTPYPTYLRFQKEKLFRTLHTPHIHHLKVVDTDNNAVLAYATWEFYENGRSDEQLKELEEPFEPGKEKDSLSGKVQRDWFAYLNGASRALGKMPHGCKSVLSAT